MTRTRNGTLRRALLACGIASSLLYVAMNVLGAWQYPGYSSVSHTVSELSAIGAPSRPLWVALGLGYNVLLIAFAVGILGTEDRNRALRVVGWLLIANAALGLAWPPMHPRGTGFTGTDTLHIAFTVATVVVILLTLGIGALAFGKRFRLYSIATLLVVLVFGTLAGMDGPRIAANQPTPWAGLTERINIGAYLLWIIVLAVALLRPRRLGDQREAPATHRVTGALGSWLLG